MASKLGSRCRVGVFVIAAPGNYGDFAAPPSGFRVWGFRGLGFRGLGV